MFKLIAQTEPSNSDWKLIDEGWPIKDDRYPDENVEFFFLSGDFLYENWTASSNFIESLNSTGTFKLSFDVSLIK